MSGTFRVPDSAGTGDADEATAAGERPPLLRGLFNLRDLGGYLSADGGRTRDGRIFRADSLGFITEEDARTLAGLGLRLVCDLRGEVELKEAPSRVPPGVRYDYHNPMTINVNVMGDFRDDAFDWSVFELEHLYSHMLDHSGPTFRRIFAHLADPGSYPFLFHCTAGKDRTGMVAALALRAAGVPDADVCADFALTDARILPRLEAFRERMRRRGTRPDGAEKLLRAPVTAMQATLAYLDKRYGSTAGYLQTIGVAPAEIAAFRGLFVEGG